MLGAKVGASFDFRLGCNDLGRTVCCSRLLVLTLSIISMHFQSSEMVVELVLTGRAGVSHVMDLLWGGNLRLKAIPRLLQVLPTRFLRNRFLLRVLRCPNEIHSFKELVRRQTMARFSPNSSGLGESDHSRCQGRRVMVFWQEYGPPTSLRCPIFSLP
jgi:hypothetical protein